MIMVPDFFPLQACENFSDALHDVILAPTRSNGRLTLNQCKIAWKAMISAMHVRIYQNGCSLASLTENEMFWKHHWTYHASSVDGSQSGGGGGSSDAKRLQSLVDRAENVIKQGGNNRGNRGNRGGGQRGNRGNGKSGGGKGNDGQGKKVPTPPAPPGQGQGGGKSSGRSAFNKRARAMK